MCWCVNREALLMNTIIPVFSDPCGHYTLAMCEQVFNAYALPHLTVLVMRGQLLCPDNIGLDGGLPIELEDRYCMFVKGNMSYIHYLS